MSGGDKEGREEAVREVFAAFNQGGIDAGMIGELFSPDVELLDFPEVPDRRVYRGHAGIREFLADIEENWKETDITVDEVRRVGDAIVVLGRQTSVGARAGVPVENDFGEVVEFEGDRISRVRMFRDHEATLEAADA